VANLFTNEENHLVPHRDAVMDSGSAETVVGTSSNSQSMAESVTRHASSPLVDEFQFLLCGIDSLDLGLYVMWGSDWKRRVIVFDKKKQEARKKGGLLIGLPSGRKCIFRPNGKGENYRFQSSVLKLTTFLLA